MNSNEGQRPKGAAGDTSPEPFFTEDDFGGFTITSDEDKP